MSTQKTPRLWPYFVGILLSLLFFYFVHGRSEILAYGVPLAALGSLVLIWPRLKAEAAPSKKSDFIGYLVIGVVLAGALWLVLILLR